MQAIKRLTAHIDSENDKPLKSRKLVVAILLDIKNAFNSLSWPAIKENLARQNISPALKNLINSYLKDRTITCKGITLDMTAGVPQGSILGPTLWNLTYNGIFNLDLPDSTDIIGVRERCGRSH